MQASLDSHGNPSGAGPYFDALLQAQSKQTRGIIQAIRSVFGAAPNDNEGISFYPINDGTNDFVALAASTAGVTGAFTVDNAGDFIATRIIGVENTTAEVLSATMEFSVNIRASNSNRNVTFGNTNKRALVGTALQSVPFAKNWLVPRQTRVVFTFNNLIATACRIWWAVWGWSVQDYAALNLTRRLS